MAMTREQFEAIALAVRNAEMDETARRELAEDLAGSLKGFAGLTPNGNSRFDRERFLAACEPAEPSTRPNAHEAAALVAECLAVSADDSWSCEGFTYEQGVIDGVRWARGDGAHPLRQFDDPDEDLPTPDGAYMKAPPMDETALRIASEQLVTHGALTVPAAEADALARYLTGLGLGVVAIAERGAVRFRLLSEQEAAEAETDVLRSALRRAQRGEIG